MRTLYVRDLAAMPAASLESNVAATYDRATSLELDRGAHWYDEAREHAALIGQLANVTMRHGAAAIAVLSPQLEWTVNLAEAYAIAAAVADGTLPDDNTFRAFRRNVHKSWACLQPDANLAELVTGPKVTSFYRAIAGLEGGPVIDRHAVRGATGHGYAAVTAATYRAVQSAYVAVARALAEDVHGLQATVWLTVKRELRAGIGQLELGL